MDPTITKGLPAFLELLGLDEAPMGIFHADTPPDQGLHPKTIPLPTREAEQNNAVDWGAVFGNFSCAMGHVWRARKKRVPAWFSADNFGCPGAVYWMGFLKPQTETIIHYVSSGIPGHMEGEFYCEGPNTLRRIFAEIDPVPAPKRYLVVQPLETFHPEFDPELVTFFSRPESLCGLHQLAFFVTNDPEVVVSPWSAGCGGMVAWPFRYLAQGKTRAVIGGWDPSARKFHKNDELTFTIPYAMFAQMVARFEGSFLGTKTWSVVRQKISRGKKVWGEKPDS